MTLASPFIRPYELKDKDDMIHIFRETAAPELQDGGEPALHYSSYLWCRPYIYLQPQNCFVLDDGNGNAVGYIIGTPDTRTFVHEYREKFIPHLETEGVHKPGADEPTAWKENLPNALRNIAYNPEGMLQQAWPALLEEYPAHLHIDILKGYRRGGLGRKLIDHFCNHVAKQGAIGVHLGMAAANVEAGNFYDRIGIRRYPHVLDGVGGELGRTKENTIIRVKTLR